MLNEKFVESIAKLAVEADKTETIDIGENKRAVILRGEIVERFKNDEPFGTIQVSDFSSLVDAAVSISSRAELTNVKVMKVGILVSCDWAKPHAEATAKMDLTLSEAFACLCTMETPRSVSFINKALRTKLAGTFDEKLVAVFRQVEFSRSGATRIEKSTHRDTMGKSVDNAVKSLAGELPEFISFTVPLFANAPCDPVRLLYFIEVNHDNETIGFAPVGDAIGDAYRAAIASIVMRLKGELPTALVVAG